MKAGLCVIPSRTTYILTGSGCPTKHDSSKTTLNLWSLKFLSFHFIHLIWKNCKLLQGGGPSVFASFPSVQCFNYPLYCCVWWNPCIPEHGFLDLLRVHVNTRVEFTPGRGFYTELTITHLFAQSKPCRS